MIDEKRKLRALIKHRLSSLSRDQRYAASLKACATASLLKHWKECDTVIAYLSDVIELDIRPLLEKAWIEKKIVGCVRVIPRTRQLEIRHLRSFEDTHVGAFSFPEPDPEKSEILFLTGPVLVLVPGLAFDRQGGRLGRGLGFYDRFLPTIPSEAHRLSLCFSEQLLPEGALVPRETHDLPVDSIITADGLYTGWSR